MSTGGGLSRPRIITECRIHICTYISKLVAPPSTTCGLCRNVSRSPLSKMLNSKADLRKEHYINKCRGIATDVDKQHDPTTDFQR